MINLDELKAILDENEINVSDLDDILSVAACSHCCQWGGGGNHN